MNQATLDLRSWGGARRGAGRRAAGARSSVPHAAREPFRKSQPIHVSLRLADHVWNLRSERAYLLIQRALTAVRRRPDFRVAHFSVQENHLHLIVEDHGPRALANGIRALSIRIARSLNAIMGRSGPVFDDRFHAHVLRTPTEVRNALRYVIGNHAGHLRRLGQEPSPQPDRFSSAVDRVPWGGQLELWPAGTTREAQSWLLRGGGAAGRGRGPLFG